MTPLFGTPLFGISIEVSRYLAGSSRAARIGDGPICVSPAMYDLISKAESENELRLVLENISVLQLPAMDFNIPMITHASSSPPSHSQTTDPPPPPCPTGPDAGRI